MAAEALPESPDGVAVDGSGGCSDLDARVEMLRESNERLRRSNQRLLVERRRLARLALLDGLTGLPNRRMFDEALDRALVRSRWSGATIGVLLVDLDGFKAINDTMGHPRADLALTGFARRLGATVRANDLAARLGGDEFAIVARTIGHPSELEVVARRVLVAARAPSPPLPGLSASIGAVECGAGSDRGAVLRAADDLLYEAKRAGGDRFVTGRV
ncbi:MAG: GGDEF domain-containing protein [Actinomycetota bacterium]|nr:GGDEF domain-containing protein [Actinomycetota bacterium]